MGAKKLVWIFFIILCSSTVLSNDWLQSGKDVRNTRESIGSLQDSVLLNYQNITWGNGFDNYSLINPPLLYDLNGDGYNDLFVNDNGILKIYTQSSTTGNFTINQSIILPELPLTSFTIYETLQKQTLIFASTNNAYFYTIGNSTLYLSSTVPLISPLTFGKDAFMNALSFNCIQTGGSDFCFIRSLGADVKRFNFTNTASVTLLNFTQPLNYSTITYTPVFVEDFDALNPKIALYCNNITASTFGVEEYNMDGTIFKRNCNLFASGTGIPFSDLIYKDINGDGLKEINFFVGGNGANHRIFSVTPSLQSIAGFPTTLVTGGAIDIGYGILGQRPYLMYSTANTFNFYMYNNDGTLYTSQSFNAFMENTLYRNSAGNGADFITSGSSLYNFANLRYSNISRDTIGRDIITSDNGGLKLVEASTSNIRFFKVQVPPVTFVNYSIHALTKDGNIPLSDFNGYIVNGTTGQVYYTLICGGLTCAVQTASNFTNNLSLSGFGSGFLPYNNATSFYQGNHDLTIYISSNVSGQNFTLDGFVYDQSTGTLITSGFAGLILQNGSNAVSYGQITLSDFRQQTLVVPNTTSFYFSNLPVGNYTLTINALGYNPLTKNYQIVGNTGDTLFLSKLTGVINESIPFIGELIPFSEHSFTDANGVVSYIDSFFPVSICINQSVWINFTALKSDNKTFEVLYSCGLGDTNNVQYLSKTAGTIGKYEGLTYCVYNQSGQYTMTVWARSFFYPYTLSDVPTLVLNGVAKQSNITVSNTTCNTNIVSPKANPKEDTGIAKALGSVVTDGFGVQSFQSQLFLWFFITTILALVVGGSVARITQEASGFIYGVVIVFSVSTMIFVFVWNLIAGFVLFGIIMLLALGVLIASKRKVFKNEG